MLVWWRGTGEPEDLVIVTRELLVGKFGDTRAPDSLATSARASGIRDIGVPDDQPRVARLRSLDLVAGLASVPLYRWCVGPFWSH